MANIEDWKRRSKMLIIGVSDEGKERKRKIMRAIIQGYFAEIK